MGVASWVQSSDTPTTIRVAFGRNGLRFGVMGARGGERRRAGRVALLAAVALLSLVAVACGGSEWRLDKLKSDPIATYMLPAAIDTRATEIVGGTSGVSSPSMVRITFTVPEGGVASCDRGDRDGRHRRRLGADPTPTDRLQR